MKKNYLIVTVCLIVAAGIAAAAFYISLFYIGNPKSDSLYIDNIVVTKDLVQLDGGTTSSAETYRNYEYNIEGEDLYITINYVLASKTYRSDSFSIQIKDDFSQVKRIYLDDKENKKLIWQKNQADAITPAPPESATATAISLSADRITSGRIEDGRVGGVLQYQMTAGELKAFINYFNLQEFTENDKKEGSSDRDSLSDSTDVILQLDGGTTIYIMGYDDGETVITNQDGSGYSIFDPELTDYMITTMGGILREKGVWD